MFTEAKVIRKDTPPAEYFAANGQERGVKTYPVSSSTLREFAHCPARWKAGYQPPESEAKEWGSLVDCLALTPQQFEARYAVQPEFYEDDKGQEKPWHNGANACKKWRAEHAGKEIVSAETAREAREAVATMLSDGVIAAWVEASDRQVWVEGFWQDEKSGLSVPVRCLIDFVPRVDTEFSRCLGDLKTTRTAAVLPWQRDCYRMRFDVQAAFNLDLYVAATSEDRSTWCWVLSESYPPYQPAKRMLSQDFLDLGRAFYRRALENYCACLKADRWPGYDDNDESVQGWTLVQPEPWMAGAEAFAPRIAFDEPVAEEARAATEDVMP